MDNVITNYINIIPDNWDRIKLYDVTSFNFVQSFEVKIILII